MLGNKILLVVSVRNKIFDLFFQILVHFEAASEIAYFWDFLQPVLEFWKVLCKCYN